MEFEELSVTPSFTARSGHTVCRLNDGLVCVGGYDGSVRFGDVWKFFDEGLCSRAPLRVNGAAFQGRAGHCMVQDGGSYLVALGYASDDALLGDVLRLTVNDEVANFELLCESGGMARRWAACGSVQGGMAIFGGWNDTGPQQDFRLFDAIRQRWSPALQLAGDIPSPRRWSGCEMVGDGQMLLSGGFNGGKVPLGDAFLLDFVAGKSKRLDWKLQRSRHTICGGKIIGGYDERGAIAGSCFDVSKCGTDLIADGACWVERAGHAACCLSDGTIALIGGFVGRKQVLTSDAIVIQ